jgi:hypothetical protein
LQQVAQVFGLGECGHGLFWLAGGFGQLR